MSKEEDKSVGVMLGVACGDVLGAGVEGMEAQIIVGTHGRVENFLNEEGRYTDDTQMTIALADSLVECGGVSFFEILFLSFLSSTSFSLSFFSLSFFLVPFLSFPLSLYFALPIFFLSSFLHPLSFISFLLYFQERKYY